MTIWAEWKQEKEKQYLDPTGIPYPYPVRHMQAFYGRGGGGTCEDCIFMQFFQDIHISKGQRFKKSTYRCVKFNPTKGRWDTNSPACGLKEEKQKEIDL